VRPPFELPPRQPAALSAQSTFESVASDAVFDGHENMPAWMPSTQDTEYSTVYESQPVVLENQYQQLDDDDDSWPLDEKLPPGTVWPFVGDARDDSLTWSDVPSPGPDGDAPSELPMAETFMQSYPPPSNHVIPGTSGTNPDQSYEEEYLGLDESELEEMAVEQGLSTVSLVEVCHSSVVRVASLNIVLAQECLTKRQPAINDVVILIECWVPWSGWKIGQQCSGNQQESKN
jgi:hypothetical protein